MSYREDVKLFKALADQNRLRILELLQTGEKCACVLLDEMDIAQPTLSHHMKLLVDSQLVDFRKEGKWVYYQLHSHAKENIHAKMKQYFG